MSSTLLDEILPHYDFVERHSLRMRGTPERIYDAIRTTDLAAHPIARTLIALRGMGRNRERRIDDFSTHGFALIGDNPPHELVLGLQGPFWNPACKLHDVDRATFDTPLPAGVARAAWNFTIGADGEVATETRVVCARDARAKFRLYWLFVRPFSGLIRILMLRTIRRAVEAR